MTDAALIIFSIIITVLGIINLIATIHEPAISRWRQTVNEARDSQIVPQSNDVEGVESSV